jgi:parallel beta-helix repeat protein
LILVLLLFASLVTERTDKAQTTNMTTINTDGSVSGTNLIQRDGNHYTLTSSLSNVPIVVECNNILLNGGGFTLQGEAEWGTPAAINLTCTNVTVENFNIATWEVGILGAYNNNTIANCSVTNCERGVAIYADNYVLASDIIASNSFVGVRILNGNGNVFVGNLMQDNGNCFFADNSSSNLVVANTIQDNLDAFSVYKGSFFVYNNNFVDQNRDFVGGWYTHILTSDNVSTFRWDNGYPSGGNYYNDYATRHPNATEIDTSGIEDTPYVVNENPAVNDTLSIADRYPLLLPVNISEAEKLSLEPFPSMSPPTLPTRNPTASASSPPPSVPTASPMSTSEASPSPVTTQSNQEPSPRISRFGSQSVHS